MYFRGQQDIKPYQEVDILLTSTGSLLNNLSDAKFIPANKIEQMKIKEITQSNTVFNEYTAKIRNGRNNHSFFLGQKFCTILSIMFILFFSTGVVENKKLPPSPKPLDLKQKTYSIYGYNCHNPESIQYIDKDHRCNSNIDEFQDNKLVDWDILVHPLKQKYSGFMCSIVKSSITMRCGIWSYNQIISIPETEVQLHITSSEFQAMIQEGVYRTPDGRELSIKMDVENVFKFTLNGEIHAQTDKTNFCQGKDLQVETGIIENAIILEQYKINIINTTILSETNQRLISEIDM